MEIEWKKAVDFAEVAEAIGVETQMIMAAQIGPSTATVLYTPELDENNADDPGPIMLAQLARDVDGILLVISEPRETNFKWADVKTQIEAEIERRLDDQA